MESALELRKGSVTARDCLKDSRIAVNWGLGTEVSNVHWSDAIKHAPVIYSDREGTKIFSKSKGGVLVASTASTPQTSLSRDMYGQLTDEISLQGNASGGGWLSYLIQSPEGALCKSPKNNDNRWAVYKTPPNADASSTFCDGPGVRD